MSRTQKAFDRRFLELFAEIGARDREKGIAWIHQRAHQLLESGITTLSHAYTEIAINLLTRTQPFRTRRIPPNSSPTQATPLRLHCDAGLGGLARWLRAFGCEAFWQQDISDAELVRQTQQHGGILLTADSMLLDRRPIVRGEIRALWIPPTLTIHEQLAYLRAELNLPPTDESRCMRCGGQLLQIDNEQARHRIPPRTYKWLNDFFECTHCHQLFWEGNHWQRIQSQLTANPHDT
jgi:uncharacterized protein with PIN domain